MARTKKEQKEFSIDDIVSQQKEIVKTILNNPLKIIAKNKSQRKLIQEIKGKEIVFCEGRAGTGKSFICLAQAVDLLFRPKNKYSKIYLVKSVTTLKGEEIGFIKGDLKEKIKPFMWSFILNLRKLIPEDSIRSLLANELVEELPLAYIRGASLDNCIVIVDEFQNISIDNAKTLLTRIGENAKIICIGDSNQIDLKNKNQSSLSKLMDTFQYNENFGIVNMNNDDINCRNPLINDIEDGFDKLIID